jgi:hypothetical protein
MKKVTVTLTDDLARRVHVAAAKEDKSLSRFVAGVLEEWCQSAADEPQKLALLWKFLTPKGKMNCCVDTNLMIFATRASDHKLAPNFELSR